MTDINDMVKIGQRIGASELAVLISKALSTVDAKKVMEITDAYLKGLNS